MNWAQCALKTLNVLGERKGFIPNLEYPRIFQFHSQQTASEEGYFKFLVSGVKRAHKKLFSAHPTQAATITEGALQIYTKYILMSF